MNGNIDALQQSDLKLDYMTRDARDTVRTYGLDGLTIFWQIRLMEKCYNAGVGPVASEIERIRKSNPGLPANEIMRQCDFRGDIRRGKQKVRQLADFDLRGSKNLFTLDQTVLYADYSVRLDDLSSLLNAIHPATLAEWLEGVAKLGMPLVMLQLEEFNYHAEQSIKATEKMARVELRDVKVMDDKSAKVLEDALKEVEEDK